MWDKIKNLLNLKVWLTNFVTKELIAKWVKHGASAAVGLLFGVKCLPYVQPIADAFNLNAVQIESGLVVLFTGLAGYLFNLGLKVMDHEG